MKYSIRKQFAVVFIAVMSGAILLCWFINSTLLEKYYIQNKQKVLLMAYDKISTASKEGTINSDEFDIELIKVCNKYNINVLILDSNSRTVKSSSNDVQFLTKRLMERIFFGAGEHSQILEKENSYIIQNSMDERTQTEFLEMWGYLNNGNIFMIRSAIEGIRDSVMIANRFLAYVGVFSALLGAIVIFVIAKKVTNPILKLADISERMTHLDFEAKYQGDSNNEIAVLGNHINQLSETLEKTISELKTANLELQKDIARREKLDEMRIEFLSNVSHELKTPIALIQGYAEGLLEGVNDDEESKHFYCEVIADEANKMNSLVKQIMTLNQLEFGQDQVKFERFDINDLIRNTIHASEIVTKQLGVTVKFHQDSPCYVWGDEFLIEEVFRNYYSNAYHHAMGDKEICITVKIELGKVRVAVFNTGKPIPEESLPYLWDKFYKVDKARTREYGGSGVGLSIVKAIMDSLLQPYGVINYENGVEFWFELETK